jgi:hypothetical protein
MHTVTVEKNPVNAVASVYGRLCKTKRCLGRLGRVGRAGDYQGEGFRSGFRHGSCSFLICRVQAFSVPKAKTPATAGVFKRLVQPGINLRR